MKKKIVILMIVIIIVATITIVMIIRHNNDPEVQLEKANKEIQDVMKEERYLSDSELDEILKNTGKVLLSQINYDFTTEMYNFDKKEFESWKSGHIWSSGTNIRHHLGENRIIVNRGVVYWGRNKFRRVPLNYSDALGTGIYEMHTLAVESSAVEIIMCLLGTSTLKKENIKYFGEERIDNKDAIIIGGNCNIHSGNYEVKLWIWEEKGITIKSKIMQKVESDSLISDYNKPYRIIFSFENISFDEFDKSIFHVSEDELLRPNKISSSKELKDNVFKDSDNDGLIDYVEENVFNTDPNNSDSDGDGHKDGDEIENAYDPNGDGRLFGEFQ